MKEFKTSYLGEKPVGKLLFRFAMPCVLSLLISALYNIVDQIFIGNSELGYLGNAATGVVFPLLIITQAFAWWISDGCAAFLSICQGKKDTENAHKSIGTGIVVNFVISMILLTLGLIFKEPILRTFGASDQTIDMAIDYFTIVASFFPVFMFMNGLNAVIRSDGSPVYSMICQGSGAIINIILDPIFIFACKWGITGAAWATVIGQCVSALLTFIYLFNTKTFKLTIKSFIPNFKVFKNIINLGISSFITQVSIVAIALVCNIVLAKYGAMSIYGPDIPISVISVETKVFTVLVNIVVGIALGGQPILGYNIGCEKMSRVKKTYLLMMMCTIIVGLVFTLLNEIYPDMFIIMFGNGGDLYMEFARKTFRVFLSLVTFTLIIKVSAIFFQSIGSPIKASIASLIRDIVCFIPCCFILPILFEKNGEGVIGILYSAPIADIIGIAVTIILTIFQFKKMNCSNEK